MKKSKIAKVISVILIILLILGIVSIFFVPKLFDIFNECNPRKFSENILAYRITFYLCYLVGLGIIYKLISLFNCIYKNSPFKKEVEMSLKIIAILFMLLSLFVFVNALFIPTLISFVIVVICFVTSLSFYVLAQIIKAAITYKNEIDYTI